MAVKAGDVVYLWAHAYLRVIGCVTEVLGQRRVALRNASKVIADDRGDEVFFMCGIDAEKSRVAYLGDVADIAYLAAVKFPHALPGPKSSKGKEA